MNITNIVNQTFVNTDAHIRYLEELILQNRIQVNSNTKGADTAWIANSTYLVFLMQTGFSLLEAGTTRYKNYVSALIKNALDLCVSTIAWWLLGYAFAFGESKGRFIGTTFFAADGITTGDEFNNWMFQWAFAGTAATIVSGCILERAKVWGYLLYAFFMITWIYPLIVHWCWNSEGWLKDMGYIDFAGSGVVHMVGGVAALAACIMVGPRIGRFDTKDYQKVEVTDRELTHKKKTILEIDSNKEFKANYIPFCILGTLMLWFSWYGFNCGSTITIVGDNSDLIGKIGMNTSISAAISGLTCFMFNYIVVVCNKNGDDENYEVYSVGHLCNGILAGLVGITAGCDIVESWAAFVIGIISCFIYLFYSWFLKKLHIDDALDACPIHMGCGSWGVIAVGWFHPKQGILYGGGGKLFGVNFLGIIVIFFWTAIWTVLFFLLLKLCKLDRVDKNDEENGLDMKYCGGYADHFCNNSRRHMSILFDYENRAKEFKELKKMETQLIQNDTVKRQRSQSMDKKHPQEFKNVNTDPRDVMIPVTKIDSKVEEQNDDNKENNEDLNNIKQIQIIGN